MCLKTNEIPILKRTEKEETFYKVLFYYGGDSYRTPYRGEAVYVNVMQLEPGENFSVRVSLCGCEITEGGFHLFKRKEEAENEARWLNRMCPTHNSYRVVKAIVPEGTPYIEGKYGTADAVIVKKVTYTKI